MLELVILFTYLIDCTEHPELLKIHIFRGNRSAAPCGYAGNQEFSDLLIVQARLEGTQDDYLRSRYRRLVNDVPRNDINSREVRIPSFGEILSIRLERNNNCFKLVRPPIQGPICVILLNLKSRTVKEVHLAICEV